jgi:hypothetical protein
LLLNISKTVLAFAGKELPDRAAQLVLNHMVRINKRQAKTAPKLSANGGFAGAGKAHEDDAQDSLALKKVGCTHLKMQRNTEVPSVFDRLPPCTVWPCRTRPCSAGAEVRRQFGLSDMTRGVININNSLFLRV